MPKLLTSEYIDMRSFACPVCNVKKTKQQQQQQHNSTYFCT